MMLLLLLLCFSLAKSNVKIPNNFRNNYGPIFNSTKGTPINIDNNNNINIQNSQNITIIIVNKNYFILNCSK